MESFIAPPSPGGNASASDFFMGFVESESLKEQRELWYQKLLLTQEELIDTYKRTFSRYTNNEFPPIEFGDYDSDLRATDFECFVECRVDSVWKSVILPKTSYKYYEQLRREDILRSYIDSQANYPVKDYIDDFLRAYSLVRDEINIYRMFTKGGYKWKLASIKATIRNTLNAKEIERPDATLNMLIKALKSSKNLMYKTLERIITFRAETKKKKTLWLCEAASLVQDLDDKVIFDTSVHKITDAGIVMDDREEHPADADITGGTFKLVMLRTKEQAKHGTVQKSIKRAQLVFEVALERLFLLSGAELSDSRFETLLMIEMAKIAQGLYGAGFVLIQNTCQRFITLLETNEPETYRSHKKLIDVVMKLCSERVTLCWDTIFSGDHMMASRVIGYYKAINEGEEAPKDYMALFANGMFSQRNVLSQVLRDEVMLKHNRRMISTYLCNVIYLLTHTSVTSDRKRPGVFVHFITKPSAHVEAEPAMFITTSHAIVYANWRMDFKKYFAKFDRFTPLATIDKSNGNGILQLKMDVYEDTASSQYAQMKRVGTSETMTTLQALIGFIIKIVLKDHLVVSDVMISTTVCTTGPEYKLMPHLPYKFMKREISAVSNAQSPKYYIGLDYSQEGAGDNVLGVNDLQYSAPTFFTLFNPLESESYHRIFHFLVQRDLIKYIEDNAVECFSNYFFTKKLFEKFEDLRLGFNMETLHFSGTTKIARRFRSLTEMHTLQENIINIEMSRKLEELRPNMKNDPIKLEKLERREGGYESFGEEDWPVKRQANPPSNITLKRPKLYRDL